MKKFSKNREELKHKNSQNDPQLLNNLCRGRKPVLDLITKTPELCEKLLIADNVRPPFLDEILTVARNA